MGMYRDKTRVFSLKTRWLWMYIHIVLPLFLLFGTFSAVNAIWQLHTDAYASLHSYFAKDTAYQEFIVLLYVQEALYIVTAVFSIVLFVCMRKLLWLSYILNGAFLVFVALLLGYETMVNCWLILPPSLVLLMALVVVGTAWVLPNAVYFYKRRELFATSSPDGVAITVEDLGYTVNLPAEELAEPTTEDLWLCRGCGCELVPEAKFCHECGRETGPVIELCSQCSAELLPNAKFCRMCGAEVV